MSRTESTANGITETAEPSPIEDGSASKRIGRAASEPEIQYRPPNALSAMFIVLFILSLFYGFFS